MKRFVFLIIGMLLYSGVAIAQNRVIDASDRSPIAAASVFDATGNIVGLTLINGEFPDVPLTSYPITLRCIGYEDLTIKVPANRTWEMKPMIYELEEIVVVPVKRNVLKQTFYAREYLSLRLPIGIDTGEDGASNYINEDTITFFLEHMAVRYVPTTKDAKFGGDTSLRILNSRCYSRYNIADMDSVAYDAQSNFPSMLSLCTIDDTPIDATDEFKGQSGTTKQYKKPGKSGMAIVMRQNANTFKVTEDMLARKKDHTSSPWLLSLSGLSMDINQLFSTQTYRATDKCIYQPKDIMEASFVMQADGKGRLIRKAIKTKKPIVIRSMVEVYLVENEYLTKEEAKREYKDDELGMRISAPSTVPPMNAATQQLVKRAKAESKKK